MSANFEIKKVVVDEIKSYAKEAKAIGIKMGAPYFQVEKMYPQAICIPARHFRYAEISAQVMAIIKTFSPDVEIVSIDEAYVDLTGLNKVYKSSYTELITKIRQTIFNMVKIPVSIGLGASKTLAKLASDKAKNNNGIYIIRPDRISETIGHMNIEDICGIGNQSAKILKFNGIFTIKDFIEKDNSWIKKVIGINGLNLKFELIGTATSLVNATPQAPQSIQDTKSFEDFTDNLQFLHSQLNYHVHSASQKLRSWNGYCGEIGVILKTKDFNMFTLYSKLEVETNSDFILRKQAAALLDKIYKPTNLYRSIGVELRKLSYNDEIQQSLFETLQRNDDKLSRILDDLEHKFGKGAVRLGE